MLKALIVEDEPEANELLSLLVQLRGYQTDSAFTGGEAMEKVESGRPNLVFLDLMLPDINGYEVCRNLKGSRETSGIPIVMVTARLAAENRLHGFSLGATGYVSKPYTPAQIFAAMTQAEHWRRSVAEGAVEGVIRLDSGSDVEHFLDISRLGSLLMERSSLLEEATRGLEMFLVSLALRAIEWGVVTGHGLVATIHYRWSEAGVVLSIRDKSGWFAADPPGDLDGLGGMVARGRFDEITYNDTTCQVFLTLLSPARV